MSNRKEFTKKEMRFIIRIADEGLENPEEDDKFEKIRNRAWSSHKNEKTETYINLSNL